MYRTVATFSLTLQQQKIEMTVPMSKRTTPPVIDKKSGSCIAFQKTAVVYCWYVCGEAMTTHTIPTMMRSTVPSFHTVTSSPSRHGEAKM